MLFFTEHKPLNSSVQIFIKTMAAVTAALKPVLLAFLTSAPVRRLVVDLLAAYSATTGNTIDDNLVGLVATALGVAEEAAE